MDIEKMINVELFKTITLEVALTLRGGISEQDITKVWKKLNPVKRKSKGKESEDTEQESE